MHFRALKIALLIFTITYSIHAQNPNPQIVQLLNQVNKDSLSLFVRQLSGDTSCIIGGSVYTIVSRHKNQPGNDKAAQFIYEKFQSYGLQVQYENFSSTGKNVIATKQGLNDSHAYFVVCAHYDDMPSGTTAPGADDNASGTATVLELARVFSKFNFNYTIKFICFDEEEQGLIGSNYYATQARNRNDSIIGVINLDMTAYDANNDGMVDVHSNNVSNTSQIANEWINNIYQYGVNLTPRTVASQPYSDHYSFQQKNYGAILVIEYDYEFNPRYHTVNDRYQYLNMNYAYKIAQVSAATAAEYAQIQSSNIVTLLTNAGWNLISIPIQPLDGRKSVLFPSATSFAYSYDNSYVVSETLKIGKGYWLKFNSSQTHQIQGQLINQFQVPIKSGWNLIGTLNGNIPVSSITTQPPDIISSLFYEYDGSYSPANVLSSGKGYWVKSSQNGTINLSLNYFRNVDVENPNLINEFEYRISFWNSNANMDLYLTSKDINEVKYELPPHAPNELLDVRFSTNTFVSKINQNITIHINAQQYPVFIKIHSKDETVFSIELNGQIKRLKSNEVYTLQQPVDFIKIKKSEIPQDFVVYQNFPNPFNPKTEIQFFIDKENFVKLNIYDMSGRLLETLINGKLERGLHTVIFDGSKYSSGVYLYEIKTETKSSIKKMLLIK